jgi:(5-formylfuran-3-yl)methyl phosphate synthase
MTRLLVSVRDAREAEIAIAEGVDLIDVKEPARGALGAADARTLEAIARSVAGRAPLSAALGELLEAISMPPRLASQLRYAKFGLAGCARHGDWKDRWQRAIANLPAGVSAVAVAYADVNAAHSPEVETVLANARAVGCAAVLFDTFGKSEGSLVDHLGLSRLNHLIAEARRVGLLTVVAGGLNGQRIRQILPLEPDYVGVRGAACRGDRSGRLDRRRVSKLVALVGDAVSDSACTPVR